VQVSSFETDCKKGWIYVKTLQRPAFALGLLLLLLPAACAPIKTLDVWKSETDARPLKTVMIIAVAQEETIRRQAENVLADQLAKRGVDATASHKVLPKTEGKPDREAILAKVKELGVDSVLVARSISKEEITNHQYGGVVVAGLAIYNNGWYGASYGYSYDKQYDTDFFTISIKLYDVNSEKPFWSVLSQVKVEGSRQKAVNLLIPSVVEQLETSQIIQGKSS